MIKKEKNVLNLLSKKYSYEMLKLLGGGPKRFKDMSDVCRGEKMRTQRLREFDELSLIKIRPQRVGRRSFSVYELSETGRSVLRIAEDANRLYAKKK